MSEKELYELLQTTGLPVAYDHFSLDPDNEINPPFILYRNNDLVTKTADDKVYCKFHSYIIDLVTDEKDYLLESNVEKIFDDNYLPYDKEEDYLDEERVYQIRYFI